MKDKTFKGFVITPEGVITVENFRAPLHKSLHYTVGGLFEVVSYVESLPRSFCMLVNEDGIFLDLRYNPLASFLYGDLLFGNVVIMKISSVAGEQDIVGLGDDDILSVESVFRRYNIPFGGVQNEN